MDGTSFEQARIPLQLWFYVIDARTTRYPGCGLSQKICKRIEEVFRWAKSCGSMRKTLHRGGSASDGPSR
jgi:hypothetical protein